MSGDACRICGSADQPSRHHLVPRGLKAGHRFRGDRIATPLRKIHVGRRCNLVMLCRPCHDIIERGGLRSELRSLLTEREVDHIEQSVGRHWLDREYPAVGRG